eukprot:6434987-Pyramimonas_sp.AAC.1
MDCGAPAKGEASARVAERGPGSMASPPRGRAPTALAAQAPLAPPSMKPPSPHKSGPANGIPA